MGTAPMAPIGIEINGQIMEPIMAGKSSSWFHDFRWDFMGKHGKTIVIAVYSILYHSYKSFLHFEWDFPSFPMMKKKPMGWKNPWISRITRCSHHHRSAPAPAVLAIALSELLQCAVVGAGHWWTIWGLLGYEIWVVYGLPSGYLT